MPKDGPMSTHDFLRVNIIIYVVDTNCWTLNIRSGAFGDRSHDSYLWLWELVGYHTERRTSRGVSLSCWCGRNSFKVIYTGLTITTIPPDITVTIIVTITTHFKTQQKSLLAGLYLPVEPTTGHSKNLCVTSIWATLWMSSSSTSLTANVKILGFKGNSIGLLREMTVGVGGVCSLTSEIFANLNKDVPSPAYFDWRGWFRAGLPFFRGDMTLRCSALILLHVSR
ncbi:hypothetical protein J6590_103436 [Homalodisca vitripennis]|nr:hypothetical protein J6590_103436 [Homalodisca vitripennis]